MPLPVSLDAVVQDLEGLMDGTTAFINRRTGELATVPRDELALVEEEAEADEADLPEWQAKMIPQLREIAVGEDWIELPSKFDIHEWQIMSNFADRVDDPEVSEWLQRAIRGRGAFRMFRDVVDESVFVRIGLSSGMRPCEKLRGMHLKISTFLTNNIISIG